LALGADDVGFRARVFDVDHFAAEPMHFQVQHLRVEIPAGIYVSCDQRSMGKSLRHVAAPRKAFFGMDSLPMGFFHAAEFLRRRFFARKVLVTFDFPTVGSGFNEVAGVRSMTPRRFADGAELVLILVRLQIFVRFVDFLGGHDPHAPVVVHGFGRRVGACVVEHEQPVAIGML
jgi:hypothetical protein